MRLHNRLAAIRSEHGMTHETLAARLGVSPYTVNHIERGDFSPTLELALRISSTFGVGPETIFSLSPFEKGAMSGVPAHMPGSMASFGPAE